MTRTIRATVDTNNLGPAELASLDEAVGGLGIEVDHVSVSDRELENYSSRPANGGILETGMYGESRYGMAVYGSEASQQRFDQILALISNRSFPAKGKRDNLSPGQRRQMRDAMIFEAHVRDGRDFFVSDDARGFIGPERELRRELEASFNTRIMTSTEFREYCAGLRARTGTRSPDEGASRA